MVFKKLHETLNMKRTQLADTSSTIAYLRSIIRKSNVANKTLWFFYSRVMHTVQSVQSQLVHYFIASLQRLVIKREIKTLDIASSQVVLKLHDGRKFYWTAKDRTSLLGLGLTGVWEQEETSFLRRIVRPGQMVVDGGANYGYYTLLFSHLVGLRGKVHSFEPLNEAYRLLQQHVLLNNAEANVLLNRYGLGERKERTNIYVMKGWGLGGATVRPSGDILMGTCQIVPLDWYIKQKKINRVDFMKLDIEGSELSALKGSIQTLHNFLPSLMIEITKDAYRDFGYTLNDLYDFLSGLRYSLYFLRRGNVTRLSKNAFLHYHGNIFAFA